MKTKPVYALACAGGGAHGAYQVGVLKYIHEHFSCGDESPFQIFSGASCGSLNTTFYAAQSFDARKSRLWLEEMWVHFHIPVYHGNVVKNALFSLYREWKKPVSERKAAWALLNPQPMRDVIERGFQRANLERAFKKGTTKGVAVSATELMSGRCCWFLEGEAATTWNLFHSMGVIDAITPAHVAASCSVPIFLPPVKIGDRYYLDGSINLNRPLSAVISMGATKILNIATDKPMPFELPQLRSAFRPRLSNVIRLLLNCLGHDRAAADEAIQLEMFNRFYRSLSRKGRRQGRDLPPLPLFHDEALPAHYRPIEIFLFQPSKRIRQTSADYATGAECEGRRRRTRFMFHERFIRELIELGYSDATAQREELRKFFSVGPRRRWIFFQG